MPCAMNTVRRLSSTMIVLLRRHVIGTDRWLWQAEVSPIGSTGWILSIQPCVKFAVIARVFRCLPMTGTAVLLRWLRALSPSRAFGH